jgi:methionyl-tRNA synthetase
MNEQLLDILDPQPWVTDFRWNEKGGGFSILCPECKSNSFSTSVCEKCEEEFDKAYKKKVYLGDYINVKEANVFAKSQNLKKNIKKSLEEEFKREVDWCDLCSVFYITCSECGNSSCNGGGCNQCGNDFDKFNESKHGVEDYLDEEECLIFYRLLTLKHRMSESLRKGESELSKDVKKLLDIKS